MLRGEDYSGIFGDEEVNAAFNSFLNAILYYFGVAVPLKPLNKITKGGSPWITG